MALKKLSDYQLKINQTLQDDETYLEQAEIDAFIQEAIGIYSRHRPLEKVAEIAGDGSYSYSLPEDWENGFSVIKKIEYPVGEQEPCYLDSARYLLYQDDTATKLRFLQDTPTAAETFLLTYTIRHSVAAGSPEPEGTIVLGDFDAVCNLAAALCCFAIGRALTQETGGATISVANETWRSVIRYSEKGKELMELFNQHLGINDPVAPVSTSFSWHSRPSYGGDFMFRRRRP